MKPRIIHHFGGTPARRGKGRPRAIELPADLAAELQQLYLATNKTRKTGSMSLAWEEFCHRHPEYRVERASRHSLPRAARDVMEQCVKHVEHHRQGAKKLREITHKPGRMRLTYDGSRRLYAGEQASWDDATINFGVVVPWPQGGCKCSDRYGVKLGRFQLLVCHDDATGYIPAWSYVIREQQGYRGEDVAAAMVRTLRDVCLYDRFVVEGGVWQSDRIKRLFDGVGVQWVDAKGRPNQKLVEGFFNRLWNQLSLELPEAQVGRWRGENKGTSELYVACRAGRKDPRGVFPGLDEALDAIERAIDKLNARTIESKIYGTWIPAERWEADMQRQARGTLAGDWLWLAAPVVETRKVRAGMLRVTTDGATGIKQLWNFSAPWLYEYLDQPLVIHFDPRAEWPVQATVTHPKSGKILGVAECVNPVPQGGTDKDIAGLMRELVRREYRVMTKAARKRETMVRTNDCVISLTRPGGDDSTPETAIPALPLPVPTGRTHDRRAVSPVTQDHKDMAAYLRHRAGTTKKANW